jgi:hypothetical protein
MRIELDRTPGGMRLIATMDNDPDVALVAPKRGKNVNPALKERCRLLYFQGLKHSVISEMTGVAQGVLRVWSTRHGWVKAVNQIKGDLAMRQARALSPESNTLREVLRSEATTQADLLKSNPPTDIQELASTPDREGRTTMFKKLVETVSMIDDWESSNRPGLILAGALCSESSVEIAASVEPAQEATCGIGPTTDSAPIQIEDNSIPQAAQVADSHSDASQAH